MRQIIIPTSNVFNLQIPDNLIGKEVELLVNEIINTKDKKATTIEALYKELDGCRVDMSSFTFNRDEANDYE
jgi:hypothetical protein